VRLLVVLAVVFTLGGTVGPGGLVDATPNRAEASTLEIDAGYAGGNFVPGRSLPVRVRIAADRLIEGTLQVGLKGFGGQPSPHSLPVEVAGGSSKEIVVSVPASRQAGNQWAAVARLAGTGLSAEAELTFTGDTELVGLLPGLVARPPQPLELEGELGTARFHQLDEIELTTPGALDPLGTVVTGPDGLGSLDEVARSNVLAWLDQGGHLVVDATPGDRVEGLPDDWQPGAAVRIPAGRGEVRLSDGAADRGRWEAIVEPTGLVLPGEDQDQNMGASWVGHDLATEVGADGGLRVPSIGWLVGFLVVYVVLAGPVLFVVLRRLRRDIWAWLVVPGMAGLFALVAFAIGSDLRSGAEASHGSVVHTSPAGTRVLSYVGLASRHGGKVRAEFPETWSATGYAGTVDRMQVDVAGPGGGVRMVERESMPAGSARVSLQPDATVGEIDLDPGGFGMVGGWGPAERTGGLEVTAEAQADGSLTGILRNRTEVRLRAALVMVAGRSWSSESLDPGEQVAWQIAADAEPANPDDGPIERPWWDELGFDPWQEDQGNPNLVNWALWSEGISRVGEPYSPGIVLAAGWTRDWLPPVAVPGQLRAGRSVFTAEAPVVSSAGALPPTAVRRELVRGSRATPAEAERFANLEESGLAVKARVVRFTLPPGRDPAPALQANLPRGVLTAEAWDGGRWAGLDRLRDDGTVIDDNVPAEMEGFDPWLHSGESRSLIPSSAVDDGVILLRLQVIDGFGRTVTVGDAR
jgi:hypothetical protein